MFKHVASLRSRLVVAFLATALFLVPVVAQEVTIEVNQCWLNCHKLTKAYKEWENASDADARRHFVKCMNNYCGGMGEGG